MRLDENRGGVMQGILTRSVFQRNHFRRQIQKARYAGNEWTNAAGV